MNEQIFETIFDLSYMAGEDNLVNTPYYDNDSRRLFCDIEQWANEFEQIHGVDLDWDKSDKDYLIEIDLFYQNKKEFVICNSTNDEINIVKKILFDVVYNGIEYKDIDFGYHNHKDVNNLTITDECGVWSMVNIGNDVIDFEICSYDNGKTLSMQGILMKEVERPIEQGGNYWTNDKELDNNDIIISNIRVEYM